MKSINTLLISALCSLVIGILALLFPTNISEWLVRVIGGLFLVPGLVSILVYLGRKQGNEAEKAQATLPLTGMGSILLGSFLLISPDIVKDYIVYVIAIFPAIFSLNQMAYLWRIKRTRSLGLGFFLWPLLVIIGAVVVCLKAIDDAALSLNIGALLCLLYALTELFNLFYFRRDLKVLTVVTPIDTIETATPTIPTSELTEAEPTLTETSEVDSTL